MAIDAKVSFLNMLEKSMGTELTADSMNKALSIVSDVLERFDMREIQRWDEEPDDLLECYLSALRVEGRSQKTLRQYRYIVTRMMQDVKIPTRRITVYHLRSWMAKEQARGVADSTLNNIRQILSGYFGWLHRESLIERNPVANLGAVKCQKKKKTTYTQIEIEKLNAACIATDDYFRNRAIIAFLESSGCRISEMTGLNRDSIDMKTGECIVLGKGNKERRIYLGDVACMLIRQYMSKRTDSNPALFIGCRGERLQPDGVRYMLKTLAGKAGLNNVHPHKFRRALTTNLLRRGMPIQEVADLLGHEKIETTMRYVVMDDNDVRNSYRRYAG